MKLHLSDYYTLFLEKNPENFLKMLARAHMSSSVSAKYDRKAKGPTDIEFLQDLGK